MTATFQEMDGGLLNNWPRLDEDTVTISPFHGAFDISPLSSNAFRVPMHGSLVDASIANIVLSVMCMRHINDPKALFDRGSRIAFGS